MVAFHDGLWTYFFFFNDTATTEIYTLSLHDALPIYWICPPEFSEEIAGLIPGAELRVFEESSHSIRSDEPQRSEEHTSELQSHSDLVCRLLLEKNKFHLCHHELVMVPHVQDPDDTPD